MDDTVLTACVFGLERLDQYVFICAVVTIVGHFTTLLDFGDSGPSGIAPRTMISSSLAVICIKSDLSLHLGYPPRKNTRRKKPLGIGDLLNVGGVTQLDLTSCRA